MIGVRQTAWAPEICLRYRRIATTVSTRQFAGIGGERCESCRGWARCSHEKGRETDLVVGRPGAMRGLTRTIVAAAVAALLVAAPAFAQSVNPTEQGYSAPAGTTQQQIQSSPG